MKLGIGIGRPDSKASDVVSKYVLRKLTWEEKMGIEALTEKALDAIEGFERKIAGGGAGAGGGGGGGARNRGKTGI